MQIARNNINIRTFPAPIAWSRMGSGKTLAHFHPATGFTFGCYRRLLEHLSPALTLTGMDLRPTWPNIGPPPKDHHWDMYRDDLIAFLDALNVGPVVGIGHSLGAVTTIRAAVKRPELFSAIVLLEPALYPAGLIRMARLTPWWYKSRHQPIAGALSRQDTWESREAALADLRPKVMFNRFSEEGVRDFVAFALADTPDGGCALMFPKDWEARIYGEPPLFWKDLRRLTHPVLGIKGQQSNAFLERQWRKWKKMRPADEQVFIDNASHLLPMEQPEATAAVVLNWLDAIEKP